MPTTISTGYVPAVYIGTQRGFRSFPSMELYNLLTPMGGHPVGSTVCRCTLEKHGWQLLPSARRIGRQPRGFRQVLSRSDDLLTATAA